MKKSKIFIAALCALLSINLCACDASLFASVADNAGNGGLEDSASGSDSADSSGAGDTGVYSAEGTQGTNDVGTGASGADSEDDSSENAGGTYSPEELMDFDYPRGYRSAGPFDVTVTHAVSAESLREDISGSFKISTDVSGGYVSDGTTLTITKGGEYTLTGVLAGNIVVDAADEEVELILSGVSVTCADAAPVYVENADKVVITAASGTFNEIIDEREATDSADEITGPENAKAAIYSCDDLQLKGHGALVVIGGFNNGIQTKNDLKIKNITLYVEAANNAIKGNDSVTVESGELVAIANGGDGIKTENTDISASGKQRGTIAVLGGNIDILSAYDGIDAAYDVEISGCGNLNIYAGSEAQEAYENSEEAENGESLGSEQNGESSEGTGSGDSSDVLDGGGSSEGTGSGENSGGVQQPAENSGGVQQPAENSGGGLNGENSGGKQPAENSGGQEGYGSSWFGRLFGFFGFFSESQTSEETDSIKGIKADNYIYINGGIINIDSEGDCVHANAGEETESGEIGAGCVEINGGLITLSSGDDGIHADVSVTVNDGYINVKTSYEGIEANQITANGGYIYVYATDDGLNASTSYITTGAEIAVNGGYLDITTADGDTDAIDSNGAYTQTGGYVFVKGGSSLGGETGSIDVETEITVTGGALAALGGICDVPSDSCCTYCASALTFGAGTYILTDSKGEEILEFSLEKSYTSIIICGEILEIDGEYTLSLGSESVLSWVQEETVSGDAGGWYGWGSWGGNGNSGGNTGGRGGWGNYDDGSDSGNSGGWGSQGGSGDYSDAGGSSGSDDGGGSGGWV